MNTIRLYPNQANNILLYSTNEIWLVDNSVGEGNKEKVSPSITGSDVKEPITGSDVN